MNTNRILRGLSAFAAVAVAGCHSLDVTNPNDPNRTAVSDPTAVEAVGGGAYRTFFNAYTGLRNAAVLATQARTFTSSWNNGNLNFYSGVEIGAADTTTSPATWTRSTRSWQNDPSAAGRTSVEAFWTGGNDESNVVRPGVYSALSAANSALTAIRKNGVVIGDAARTKRLETMSVLMQGMALGVISLNYDKGYIVDETTDLTKLQYSSRKAIRDAAVAKLAEAATLASANTFTTDPNWTRGPTYSNADIARIANTFAAMVLAWYPRDAAEATTQVDWAKVRDLTANGMKTSDFFGFDGDGYDAWVSEVLVWFDGVDGGRVSTRIAHFMDPATQVDPYLLGPGSPQPNSPDARMGNGTFGDASISKGFGSVPKDAGAGTDFMWSRKGAVFRPDRGYYHQSNIGHIRYDASGNQSPNDIYGGYGFMPIMSGAINDLVRAEALIRIGGAANLADAANLIDKTRVDRGNLSTAATYIATVGTPDDGDCMANGRLAKDGGACTLWSVLLYEFDVELLGLGPGSYYVQRQLPLVKATNWEQMPGRIFNGPRYIQGLLPGTPREMPVPAKELGVKGEALYTFGGAGAPNAPAP